MNRLFLLGTAASSALVFAAVFMIPAPSARSAVAAEPQRIAAAAPETRGEGTPAAPADVYYAGCNEVRALGKAPLYRGQPGYREGMDGDDDGIACEAHP